MYLPTMRSTLLLLAAAALPLAAQPAADEFFAYQPYGVVARGPLPTGPVTAMATPDGYLDDIFVLPSGKMLAISLVGIPTYPTLVELLPDGSLRHLNYVPGYSPFPTDARGLALDGRGRLFLLATTGSSYPPFHRNDLHEVDPVTGTFGKAVGLPGSVRAITSGPDGLWALDGTALRPLDPDTGAMGNAVADVGSYDTSYEDLETDSAGRIYHLRPCAGGVPNCTRIAIFDPATGETGEAPAQLLALTPAAYSFAIRRTAAPAPAAVYLMNGRYRAEVSYEAYDGASGWARLAPARSRDTAVFYFFEPDNWELMVKVLNGCSINARVWVYASASTDVGYTMTITNIVTGAWKSYSNPLGQVAVTVTDNQAFSCP